MLSSSPVSTPVLRRIDFPRVIGLLLLSATGLYCATPDAGMGTIPERAATPVAYVGNERGTILSYADDDPVVLLDGVRRQARHPPISIIPGGKFAPGLVTATKSAAIAMKASSLNTSTSTTGNYTAYYATLTSDRDLPDVVLMLLVFEESPDGQYTDVPKVALLGKGLGILKAGRSRDISAYFPPLASKRPQRWTVLLFSDGSQIHTSYGNVFLDGLFDVMDRVKLRRAIAERALGDSPIAVYRHFPLRFTDSQKKTYAGQTLNAQVTVSQSGFFDLVRIDGISDDRMVVDLAAQFSFWLFLPPVKNGQAQSTTFVLPIKF
jgi:hypothetical protein